MKVTNQENKPPNSAGTLSVPRMLLLFLRGSIRYFAWAILFVLLATFFEMINPRIISFTVDSVIGNEPASLPPFVMRLIAGIGGNAFLRGHIYLIALAIIAVSIPAVLFRYLFRVTNAKGAETLVERMRNKLYAKISRLPVSFHSQNQTGDIIQRCTSDVDMVKRFLSEQLTAIVRTVLLVALGLFFMFRIHVGMTLAVLVFIPVIILYSAFFHRKISSHFRECDEAEGALSAIAQENLAGVRVVRAFGREALEREKFRRQNEEYTSLWTKLSKFFSAFWGVGDLISGTFVMIIIVIGVLAAGKGELSAGEFIAFLSYNTMLIWPIRMLGRVISEMSKAGVSFSRLAYIMNAEEERSEGEAIESLSGDIVFDDVSFAYPGGDPVLSHVSFTVREGATVGILGGTGSGKSTLVKLLARLYELPEGGGRITIGGVDIARVPLPVLRAHIGLVLQEPYLFSRTLGENMLIAARDKSEQNLSAAISTAALNETIAHFEDGLETAVGERGVTLSGGQKQRVAIARMLLEETPVMVFDDSLSALDAETDASVRASLRARGACKTVFLISHRTTTLLSADTILVLDRGRLVECGTHDELLLREDGIYRRIFELQSGIFETEGGSENA